MKIVSKNPGLLIVLINIITLSLIQVAYWIGMRERVDALLFQLVLVPIVIVVLNIILWRFVRVNLTKRVIAAYAGLASTMLTYSLFIVLNPVQELPPGELLLFADVLYIGITLLLQFFVFLFLHGVLFVIYMCIKKWRN